MTLSCRPLQMFRYLQQGNREKAEKFVRKAEKLYPTKRVRLFYECFFVVGFTNLHFFFTLISSDGGIKNFPKNLRLLKTGSSWNPQHLCLESQLVVKKSLILFERACFGFECVERMMLWFVNYRKR